MGKFYENLVRPALFKLDSERAHEIGVKALALLGGLPPVCRMLEKCHAMPRDSRPVECFGLKFPNAVGLAAGFDKNGHAWPAAAALGFGHVEIGTVTRHRQAGNPRPRMFRYPSQEAIINRMGFNNDGAEAVSRRLARRPGPGRRQIPLGINLGKSKITPLDQAIEDYLGSFALLADHADYIVINVSSPNTPDLRKLQEEERLQALLRALVDANAARQKLGKSRPLLLKIAPDLNYRQIDDVLRTIIDLKLDGIIATNTTLERPNEFASVNEAGGLSGAPLRHKSTQIISYIAKVTGGKLPIIGVGGIIDGESAGEKLDAGASLVQIYTGMIYRGPFFAYDVARALNARQLAWR
ncbi:MAG TPA: quinone-dependent dihydroorotate dehydrogenase [Opitutaceae bacterium]|nr:quinone-dependent dihydroorotate dehydrogenase [Opitutaceae bacterium]